ncbi:MAG: putative lipid II flippase FtsW [Alphaproteobacteria bacterium]|nr:putative lipid II flippase FtsW [Alphaproteobacteria bacterium]
MAIARNDTSVLGRWWWTVDRWTLAALVVLAGLGLVLTATASPPVAERIGADPLYFVRKQGVLLLPALAVLVFVSLADLRQVRRVAVGLMLVSILLLAGTLLLGPEIKGATRWISIAGFSLQPSEFAKPAFAVVAAWMFSAQRLGEEIPGYLIATALFLLVLALLLMQPDVGQAAVLTAIWFTQFFLAGMPMAAVIAMAALGAAGMVAAYFIFPHVQSRIDRFLDPASGDSYQVDRAMEAFSNGGLFGRGPGEGVVKSVLPDGHADFIFAVAGEEFGLIACLLIVAIFAFVVLRGVARVLHDNDLFVVLAATGLLVQFGLQALINMASTLSLIPTKGMTLPFISYGGSSLLALAIGMGMLLALTRKRPGVTG